MSDGAMSSPAATSLGPPKDRDAAVAYGVDHIDTSDSYGPHMNQIIMRAFQWEARNSCPTSSHGRITPAGCKLVSRDAVH